MAALSTALHYAVSSLSASAAQTALLSRNIAGASDPNYSRKSALLISLPGGAVAVGFYNRSADKRLLDKLLDVSSSAAGKQTLLAGLEKLSATVGDPASGTSISAILGRLQLSLQAYEADPSSLQLANGAVQSARDMARGLNDSTAAVQALRQEADAGMAASVDRVNALLEQFKVVNDAVVRGAGTAADLTDTLDERDRILKLLSEEIGIRTVTRANNDVAIYTDGGVTLFETQPRRVSMEPTAIFTAGTIGNAVFADGVRITGATSPMPSSGGTLQAQADIRDRLAVTYQTQLDEVARGLIEMFAEQDQGAVPTLPDVVGLFTYPGAPAVPPPGTVISGLAGQITLNALAEGNPQLIRDGGFGGAAYVYNVGGAAGFQERISGLIAGFDAARGFDGAAQLGATASLKDFSAGSASWVESRRQAADQAAEFELALKSRTSDALLRKTGVNIDEEMAAMLDLERSYQASSKLIAAIDSMLAALLAAIG